MASFASRVHVCDEFNNTTSGDEFVQRFLWDAEQATESKRRDAFGTATGEVQSDLVVGVRAADTQ